MVGGEKRGWQGLGPCKEVKMGLATEPVSRQINGTLQRQHPEPRGWICFV